MKKFKEFLDEKVIQFNNAARYGNIVILAGGAGSGKGFAAKNFLRRENYKVLDIDEMKQVFLDIAKLKNKYPELKKLKLSRPEDVLKLHNWVKSKSLKEHRVRNLLSSMKNRKILPNIMFDITLKNNKALLDILPSLVEIGYDPKYINLVWILANYKIAMVRNRERERTVKDEILLKTHAGAKTTMMGLLKANGGQWINSKYINGEVHVVLNNDEETWFFDDKGKKTQDKEKVRKSRNLAEVASVAWKPKFGKPIVAGFTSLKIKSAGKSMESDKNILKRLTFWVNKNAPK